MKKIANSKQNKTKTLLLLKEVGREDEVSIHYSLRYRNYFLYLQLITRAETTAFCNVDAAHPCHRFTGREFKCCDEKCQGIFLFGTQNNQFIEWLEYGRAQSFGKGWVLMFMWCPSRIYLGAKFSSENGLIFFD